MRWNRVQLRATKRFWCRSCCFDYPRFLAPEIFHYTKWHVKASRLMFVQYTLDNAFRKVAFTSIASNTDVTITVIKAWLEKTTCCESAFQCLCRRANCSPRLRLEILYKWSLARSPRCNRRHKIIGADSDIRITVFQRSASVPTFCQLSKWSCRASHCHSDEVSVNLFWRNISSSTVQFKRFTWVYCLHTLITVVALHSSTRVWRTTGDMPRISLRRILFLIVNVTTVQNFW